MIVSVLTFEQGAVQGNLSGQSNAPLQIMQIDPHVVMMNLLPRAGILPETHLVPDLLVPDLKLVLCGTALGRRSAEDRAYYAHPNNLFWRTLHEVGLTPERLAPKDYARLLDYRIGLTDLAKHHFGNDDQLPNDAFDAKSLAQKIVICAPAILAFTSKKAASVFLGRPTGKILAGEQSECIGRTSLFVLSSPSGAARGRWDRAVWENLAQQFRDLAS